MSKGVCNLYRYAEIELSANGHYLDALSIESDPRPAHESMREPSSPVIRKGHRYGEFNPVKNYDVNLFKAVIDGNYVAFGFQNKDILRRVFGTNHSVK